MPEVPSHTSTLWVIPLAMKPPVSIVRASIVFGLGPAGSEFGGRVRDVNLTAKLICIEELHEARRARARHAA